MKTGNVLAERVVFILLLMSMKKIRWLLEQPANTILDDLPCWRWLLSRVPAAWLHFPKVVCSLFSVLTTLSRELVLRFGEDTSIWDAMEVARPSGTLSGRMTVRLSTA